MSRLTDERLAEILNPPDIIGETELVSLAREVRELREERVILSAETEGLTAHRDRLRILVARDGNLLREYTAEIDRLTRERDEANRTIDLQSRQISHQARQCQEIERERDEARELLRLFRIDDDAACEQYDKIFGKIPPQPEYPPRLVPWNQHARAKGVFVVRCAGNDKFHYVPTIFGPSGFSWGQGNFTTYEDAVVKMEWSRDGINWLLCGTEVTA